VAVLVGLGGAAAAVPWASGVIAYVGGHRLPANPMLGNGERVTVLASGFAANGAVTVLDMNARTRHEVRADRQGSARFGYVVPTTVQAGRPTALEFAGAPGRAVATGHRGNVVVTVPLLRRFLYRVAPAGHRGVAGVHTGSWTGGVANTGFDLLLFLAAAALVLVLGAVGLRAGRRPR
jgi:hypothetical protein